MAVYGPLQLTHQGQALYTKAQTGTTLNFTRMQIGGGQLAQGQDPTALTALISPIAYFNINSELANGSTATIRGIFENTNLTQSTYVCEIGLFAQDPSAGEILYAYANAGTQGDTLPPIADGPISRQFNLNITVGNATNVTVNIPANTYIPNTQMGAANGVATLDANKLVPVSQIPALSYIPSGQAGAKNGVAQLDANGKVPSNQLYDLTQQTNNFTQTQQFTAQSASIEATQIILGTSSKISSPASPIYLASAAANGMGMDQYGNLLPIAPASVGNGDAWKVKGKNGSIDFQVAIDGTHKISTYKNVLDDGSGNMTVTSINGFPTSTNQAANSIPVYNSKSVLPISGWYGLTGLNGWKNYGVPFYNAQYCLDAAGFVVLRGLVQSGGNGTQITSLPAGFRPASTVSYTVITQGGTARVDIGSDGSVMLNGSYTGYLFFDGIRFYAEQ